MPLHGKIVVIKRSGVDGTEFPLTASCLFGRRPDCDIRIQLPQVSKEHCRIDLNENKEIILTNLSTANPTRVNGEALQQSERLKHGDVITIIDRSFRFEYPPAPTPKKGSVKTETLQVLQDQQVGDTVTTETGEKRISEVSTDPLKDGTNHHNIQRSLEKTVEATKDDSLQSKTASPFNDLYQMIKKSLDVKTPRKSSASVLQTPTSRFCTPKSVRRNDGTPVISTEDKVTPKKDDAKISPEADETKNANNETPKSVKKQRRSFQLPSADVSKPEAEDATKSEATSPQKRIRTPPQRFTACEVIEQISATPKSPVRRKSKEAKPAVIKEKEQAATSPKTDQMTSPRNSKKAEKETFKKRKSEELGADLPTQQTKKKRVSFGGFLCPELFDKRLPPDSPLRKGATPRRSYVSKPKESLLRRTSVIGLIQSKKEDTATPKMRTPSPKSKNTSPKTQTPGKTSPKSRSPSSKAATPAKTSPKSRSPSSKAATPAKTSPKSRSPSSKAATPAKTPPKSRSPSSKAATPAKTSPKSRSPSSKAATPAKTSPKSKSPSPARGRSPTVQTPKVQGRFSVSLISTPSPVTEAAADHVPLVTVTPKVPQKRKSTSRETHSKTKSAAKVMRRRSSISRASMKVKNSWADIVRFGQTKVQVVAPVKRTITKKTTKKTVTKPQTPARKVKSHVSTGHADSPATIVVGRAHKLKLVRPSGAAPKLVTNIALFKKNMKMDEDLTGISEMLKTPVNERKRRSVIHALKTPVGTSVVEPSVLNTPEEPGEMMVSPLSVSSTLKDRSYNSEAVQRLLNDDDKERSFISDTPALEIESDGSSEQQCTDLRTASVITPKQKPEKPDCLTGVKRLMKTPRQKSEPIEDLRGKILKTPKQKPEPQECLTGVKRLMKTPRQKAEPIEDLRGKILKTPKQKPEPQECLTGVKRMMETPRQEAEPVDNIKVELLTTPTQMPEQEDCLATLNSICKTPQQEAEPLEDLGKPLETSKALETGDAEGPVGTPAPMQESPNLSEMTDVKRHPLVSLIDIKRKMPKERSASVEDMVGVKRLMKTPKEKGKPVEESFGIKELVETPKSTCNASVQDLEECQELVEETLAEPSGRHETNEVADQMSPDFDGDVAKELDFTHKEPRQDVLDDDDTEEADVNQTADRDHLDAVPSGHDHTESSDVMETLSMSQATVDERLSREQPEEGEADEKLSGEQPKEDTRDKKLFGEQPKEDTPDEKLSGDQPEEDEKLSEEHSKEDIADEKLSEEQPEEDETDEKSSEEHSKEDTPDEKLSEEQPEEDPATGKVTDVDTTASDLVHGKKSVRGRRVRTVECKPAVDEEEAAEHSDEPVVSAPVRGRRGKKTEAPAPSAVRKPTRGRKMKCQENPSDDQPGVEPEKAVEILLTEISAEAVTEQTSPVKENDSAEEAVVKPVRGRKPKQTPVEPLQPEPEKQEVVSEESISADAQPEKSIMTLGRPKRGRKTKPDTTEQDEVMEEAAVAVETMQQSQPPVRAKRGRNTKQEEKKPESSSVETTEFQEPAKKTRRTRKVEQDHIEPREEEVQVVEMVIPEETEAPLVAEPVKVTKPVGVATKSRRGRKPKQDPECETPAVSPEEEVPAVSSTDKLKRGRRGKEVTEEVAVADVVPEEKPDHEKDDAEPIIKQSRARGAKTAVKNEVSIPAKRARRGAALPLDAESTVLVSEPTPASVEPVKRGRRAAAKSTADDATVTSDQANPTEDLNGAAAEDKTAQKCVKWNANLEVFEIPTATPVKAARGRKSSRNVSKDADKTEEKDLSEKVVEALPVKRARRGAKVADEAESTSRGKSEADAQPKTRRGRPVKK